MARRKLYLSLILAAIRVTSWWSPGTRYTFNTRARARNTLF